MTGWSYCDLVCPQDYFLPPTSLELVTSKLKAQQNCRPTYENRAAGSLVLQKGSNNILLSRHAGIRRRISGSGFKSRRHCKCDGREE
jgi:hypothetical protein